MSAEGSRALDDVVAAVRAAQRAPLVDRWETTALVESLGWSDAQAADDAGFPDTRALGAAVHERVKDLAPPPPASALVEEPRRRAAREVHAFVDQFARSFAHALPWLVVFLLQGEGDPWMPPEVAAPLGLAVMASLVTSGAFVQAIARRGWFHVGMGEPALVRRACGQLIRLGVAVSLLVALCFVAFGFYRSLFPDSLVVLAAAAYLLLCLLWMTCGVLSVLGHPWRLLTSFAAGGGVLAALAQRGAPPVPSYLAALLVTLVIAAALARAGLRGGDASGLEMPRLSTLAVLLGPHAAHGATYFAFVFADRLVAGAAVPRMTGLSFGLGADYARGMDVALVGFFLAAGVAEYFAFTLLRTWRKRSAHATLKDAPALAVELRRRHARMLGALALAAFLGAALGLAVTAGRGLSTEAAAVALAGTAGYALLGVGAFNATVMLSVSRPAAVVSTFLPGLVLDVAVGALLAVWLGPSWAVVGLVAGAAVVAVRGTRSVRATLARADHALQAAA